MPRARPGLACAVALFWVLACLLPAGADAASIIVRRDPGLSAGQRARLRADAGVRHVRALELPNTEVVSVPAAAEDRALARLNADPHVLSAAPNVPVHAAAPPPEVSWPLNWPTDVDVDAPEAWSSGNEGAGVTIGVVDESIDAAHPDLAGQVDPEVDFVGDSGCSSAPPTGSADHGTHVAGIIAALHNGTGMSGLAPQSRIVPLRALDNCGGGTLANVVDAFAYAGSHDVPIVSASFATDPLLPAKYGQDADALLHKVLDQYPNTLYVVPAGNEGNDNDVLPVYPCSDPAENLVCVGMTDFEDAPVCWGNVGRRSVDLFAPGLQINSTVRGSVAYLPASGTSEAVPLVAAAAALIASQPDKVFTADGLKGELQRGVDQIDGLATWSAFGGRLNAARPLFPRPPGLGDGGKGGTWTSCDPDHDGLRGANDHCPNAAGPYNGCPDSDGDGIADDTDDCVNVANARQENADGDDLGDACDPTPRGSDDDGDQRFGAQDRCPQQPATTPDGCPLVIAPPNPGGGTVAPAATPVAAPTPAAPAAPQVVSVAVKVTPRQCTRGKRCRKAAKVTVRVSRPATVAVRVDHRERKHGRWSWRRVTTRSVLASARGKSLTVRGKRGRTLAKGRYRVIATAIGAREACPFRV